MHLRKPEIGDLDLSATVDHDVRELEVAVDDPAVTGPDLRVVHVNHALAGLQRIVHDLRRKELVLAVDQVTKTDAVNVLEKQKRLPLDLAVDDGLNDVIVATEVHPRPRFLS